MNYQTMQTTVKANLIDTPSVVQNAVPTLVQNAHRTLQRKHNFFVMQAEKDATTVAATAVLCPVPTDWKQPWNRPYITPQYGTQKPLTWGMKKNLTLRYNVTDTGCPVFLSDDGTNITVWPNSDSLSDWDDMEYRIVIPYFKYLPAPSANGDEDWFMLNCAEFIEFQASADGFAKDWDEAHSTYWQNRANQKLTELITADKARWLAQLDTLAPHQGAASSRLQR